jgi:hypothetical protein
VRADEREVLERAIRRVTEQAANADTIVDEAMAAGLDGSDRVVVGTKMLRAELLSVKADLERELERVLLNCVVCEPLGRHTGNRRTGSRTSRSAGTSPPAVRGRCGCSVPRARTHESSLNFEQLIAGDLVIVRRSNGWSTPRPVRWLTTTLLPTRMGRAD